MLVGADLDQRSRLVVDSVIERAFPGHTASFGLRTVRRTRCQMLKVEAADWAEVGFALDLMDLAVALAAVGVLEMACFVEEDSLAN